MSPAEQATLDAVIRRVVAAAQPDKIILFGSAVRGGFGPESDLDLLVIKSGAHRRKLAQAIYLNLFGIEQPVDVVVVTPDDIEAYSDSPGLIIGPAIREGRVVYERPAASA